MSLARSYRKALLTALSIAGCLFYKIAPATMLNFSAILVNGTCTLSLNKSTLPLGEVPLSQLRPEKFIGAQPFTLSVQNCTEGIRAPSILVTGSGVNQDNKWLFRNSSSAGGVGIMVIKSDTLPEYNQTEIQSGTMLPLATAGEIPIDQNFNFYAGVSCGGITGCSATGTGNVTASLMFIFTYQ